MCKRLYAKAIFLVLCIGISGPLMASTYSETVGNGTLTYTVTADSGTCYINQGDNHQPESYTVWQFSGFSYRDSTGIVTGLPGSGEYIQSPGGSSCPPPGRIRAKSQRVRALGST